MQTSLLAKTRLREDYRHSSKRRDRPAWDVRVGLAQSYALGKTAIVFDVPVGRDGRNFEVICGSNAFWDRKKLKERLIKLFGCADFVACALS